MDLPRVFQGKATDITISSKQHLRACEKLAGHLAKQRPNNPKDFEQNEWLKDFVMKTARLNEQTISLLEFLRGQLQEIADDSKALTNEAEILDRIRDQEETIKMLQHARDEQVIRTYERRKAQLRENSPAA